MSQTKAQRKTIQDASLVLLLWAILWWASGSFWVAGVVVLGGSMLFAARARINLHRYVETRDESLLPFMDGLESDIAYQIQKSDRLSASHQQQVMNRLGHIEAALAAVDRGFILVGENNYLRWWNASAEKFLTLNETRDLGRPLDNYLRDPAFEVLLGDISRTVQVVAPSPSDPSKTLEFSVFPHDAHGKAVIIRDITRVKQLEKTRSDFAGNVSHELKTPITVIKGYAETLVSMDEALPAPVQKAIHQIGQQADRMQDIVEDLLWLNRLENTRLEDPTPLNIKAMLTSAAQDAQELAQALDKTIVTEVIADDAWQLNGNHKEMLTAVRNLTVNAVRYGQSGVQITLSWEVTDSHALLTIADTGPGIPRADLPRLTERFYRVDQGRARATGGTGLGLAIVKHVMDRHNGRLRIKSKLGSGSQFICRFPLNQVKPAALPDITASTAKGSASAEAEAAPAGPDAT
ncbi:MAG: phosphate regulon sensor histidine kinase PhoR [Litorivicinus sp.]